MTVRTTMADIIARLRLMVDDPPGAGQVFSDQDLQDILDDRMEQHRYESLQPIETIASDGTVTYTEYRTYRQFWETDATIMDGDYTSITPAATTDWIHGKVVLSSSQTPPVLVVGSCYDIYAAAADCWDRKASKQAASVNFTADGLTVSRGDLTTKAQREADKFRNKSWQLNGQVTLWRSDVE